MSKYTSEKQSYKDYAKYYEDNPVQFVEDLFGESIKLSIYQKTIIKLINSTSKIKYMAKRR